MKATPIVGDTPASPSLVPPAPKPRPVAVYGWMFEHFKERDDAPPVIVDPGAAVPAILTWAVSQLWQLNESLNLMVELDMDGSKEVNADRFISIIRNQTEPLEAVLHEAIKRARATAERGAL